MSEREGKAENRDRRDRQKGGCVREKVGRVIAKQQGEDDEDGQRWMALGWDGWMGCVVGWH